MLIHSGSWPHTQIHTCARAHTHHYPTFSPLLVNVSYLAWYSGKSKAQHTHPHTGACTRTRSHTNSHIPSATQMIHNCLAKHTKSCAGMHKHQYEHAHAHILKHKCPNTHSYIHAPKNTHRNPATHTHTQNCVVSVPWKCKQNPEHTYVHTNTHTHTHTHTLYLVNIKVKFNPLLAHTQVCLCTCTHKHTHTQPTASVSPWPSL